MVSIKLVALAAASFLSLAAASPQSDYDIRDVLSELDPRDLTDHELAYLASRSSFERVVRRAKITVSKSQANKNLQAVNNMSKQTQKIAQQANSLKQPTWSGQASRQQAQNMQDLNQGLKKAQQALDSQKNALSNQKSSFNNAEKQASKMFG